ncbi:uncharacterized protein LOC124269584 [Haliotis rubra]|uniref:uncharacterized protein LOC124269584 n=1 Tax=Haliotis rubra TaxID=36100 RepID=UPI001EE55DA2|nr:uncharacterized protein LOC124269584 [Haliotis rubra]
MSSNGKYKIIILHDNKEWFSFLKEEFKEYDVTMEQWISDEIDFEVTSEPPKNAVFYNRCSPSSYIRGHRLSLDQARVIIQWLRNHNRIVVNGEMAIDVEDSKAYQYVMAKKCGLNVPKTIFTSNPNAQLIEENFGRDSAFVIKPNRGGRGLDVRKFDNLADFEQNTEPLASTTGLYVIQGFIPLTSGLFRAEFVGKKYLYTSKATACDGFNSNFCPCEVPRDRFKILPDVEDPFIENCTNFFRSTALDNGAIEYIYDANGVPYVIDINCNTGYNTEAEEEAGSRRGYVEVAKYVYSKVTELRKSHAEKKNSITHED